MKIEFDEGEEVCITTDEIETDILIALDDLITIAIVVWEGDDWLMIPPMIRTNIEELIYEDFEALMDQEWLDSLGEE